MSITLNTKVYDYQGFTPGGATLYKETSAGVPNGFSLLTVKVGELIDKIRGKARKQEVRWYLKVPAIADGADPCACAGDLIGDPDTIEVVLRIDPKRSTAQRTDLRTRLTELTSRAEFISSVQTLKQPTA